ncbi:MAG: hypothetical protein PHU03_03020 [Syntrophales bacterium]|nr:hypothetical protein [Syntrophales bacterium]
MKDFVVLINGNPVKRRAGTPRIAAQEAVKHHPEFGIIYLGGRDRQLRPQEILTVTVRLYADCTDKYKFSDERR